MTTVFKALTNALVAAMAAAPALAGGRVWPNRLRPLQVNHSTAIVVRLVRSPGQEVVLGFTDWYSQFAVECYGRGVTGDDPADAVDQLLQDVWPRLVAIDADALGAMSVVLNPHIEWEFDAAETPLACATLHLTVRHRTAFNQITA